MQKGFGQATHLHEFDQHFIDFIGSESRIPIGRGFSEGQLFPCVKRKHVLSALEWHTWLFRKQLARWLTNSIIL